jgi:CelD/BcsL family acetyltransferase involved in cellulose biosynthesis
MERNWRMDFSAVRSRSLDVNRRLLADFVEMEARGWKAAAGSALSNQAAWRSYFEKWVLDASARGEVLWYQLAADDRPVAAYLCFVQRDTIWAAKTAYCPEFSAYSPGNDLLMRLLEAACADPLVSRVHMITGPEWLKKWHPRTSTRLELRIFSSSWRGRISSVALRGVGDRASFDRNLIRVNNATSECDGDRVRARARPSRT